MSASGHKTAPGGYANDLAFLAGDSEMGARVRELDWSQTPLGAPETWSSSLRLMVSFLLANRFPLLLWWGPEYLQIYNDAYRPILGDKHPQFLGKPVRQCWSEIWHVLQPLIDTPFRGGPATWMEDLELEVQRHGYPEESHFTIAYSPVPDETAPRGIGGVLATVHEITEKVISQRRLATLSELGTRLAEVQSAQLACTRAAEALVQRPKDIPFALLYLMEPDGSQLRLAGEAGAAGVPAPKTIDLASTLAHSPWPLAAAIQTETAQVIAAGSGAIAGSDNTVKPAHAVVLPLKSNILHRPAGVVVLGTSPRIPLNAEHLAFLDVIVSQIAAAVANARAYEVERNRAEALAEIDRAKTTFFSNISHEFRTPLTLMLRPLEELATDSQTPPGVRQQVELARHNSMRLLKLVNSLLEFSRIEAGRVQASYEPVDLAALTRNLASTFRSAMERAQLRFKVDCTDLGEPVYVDRHMWEQIVLNLLSNAFKFTISGGVDVRLRRDDTATTLEVTDTGIGIPEAEIPRVFERFHRIEGAVGRTREGSGIGLALVHELVRLHSGTTDVRSAVGRGSTFRIQLPLGREHLPPERIRVAAPVGSTSTGAEVFVQEVLRWMPEDVPADASGFDAPMATSSPPSDERFATTFGARILLADDNADMRRYVRSLLSPAYSVESVPDGERALEAIKRRRPDLVLADVMMPRLDGFGLIRQLRSDELLRKIPVVLISARAGEESRIEGLGAGADDYLVKPFSSRELLARIGALIELTRVRRQSEDRFRAFINATSDVVYQMNGDWTEMRFLRGQEFIPDTTSPSSRWLDNYIPSEDQPVVTRAIETAIRTRSLFELEHRVLRVDGTAGWTYSRAIPLVDENGNVVEWFGTASDVTERHQMQEALRWHAAQHETLLNRAPLGVYLVDADLHIREANPTARALFGHVSDLIGRDREEMIGRQWPRDYAAEVVGMFRRTLESGAPHRESEREDSRPNRGSSVYYDWEIHRIPLPDGQQGVVCYFQDISAHVEARAALQTADRHKNEFLAMLAHELRNPLAPISNASELLSQTVTGDARAQRAINMVKRQVKHLARLVDDLLDVSRITQGRIRLNRRPLGIAGVITQAFETVDPLIREKNHRVTLTSSYHPLYVDGDFARLVQCVSNILTNAAKYSDPGGEIRITTRSASAHVEIEIADAGAGISAELLPRIFDLFVQSARTLDRSQGGLGVGLSVVKRLIEMHDGQVYAGSPGPGFGSTFTIRLPQIERPEEDQTHAPTAATAPRRILIVDDNADAADSLALLLKSNGHDPLAVYSAGEALRQVERFKPQVALLDIGLPDLDGYELAQRLLATKQSLRLVALTGYGQAEDRQRALAVGFEEHLVKPIDLQSLEKVLAFESNPADPSCL